MNLKIYKTTTNYSINYFIVDSDQPNCIGISVIWDREQPSFRIVSQHQPLYDYNIEDKSETSFLDLLAVTGITKDQVEYIFRNIDLDKYELSIRPRIDYSIFGQVHITGCSANWGGSPGVPCPPIIYGNKMYP